MKKLISLMLSIVLVLSLSTVAFAADTSSIEVRDGKNHSVTGTENTKAYTELWLQVAAEGQIDVTVPLVLVFKTNIDGGNATTANNYKITNNSSADVAVTKIATSVEAMSEKNPMTLDAYSTTDLARDHYKAQMTVAGKTPWDLQQAEHTAVAANGGLFNVAKDDATPIQVDMETGKLSFVTKTDGDKGVKLLNVSYTVAIDTQNAIGEVITSAK